MTTPVAPAPHAKRSNTLDFAINRPLPALMLLALVALSAAYQVPVTVDLSQPGVLLSGFYDQEGRTGPRPYRWTDGHARVWLASMGRQPYQLVLTLSSARPADAALPTVSVLAGDATLGTFNAPRPVRDFPFEVGTDVQSLSGDLDLHIDSETFVPSGDLRTLGLIVYAVRLAPSPEPHLVWPAPLPLLWSIVAVSLLFLALRQSGVSTRLAWPLVALVVAALCCGLATARPLTVAVLPWAVLTSTILYVLSIASTGRSPARTKP